MTIQFVPGKKTAIPVKSNDCFTEDQRELILSNLLLAIQHTEEYRNELKSAINDLSKYALPDNIKRLIDIIEIGIAGLDRKLPEILSFSKCIV